MRMFHCVNLGPRGHWLSVFEPRIEIDLAQSRHTFALNGVEIPLTVAEPLACPERFHVKRKCGEAVYALKKFLVTLATRQAITECVDRKKSAGLPKRFRDYPHTIIRVPLDETSGHTDPRAAGPKRRKHLVRGCTWGKNTRPLEERRWIAPFFRGSAELGEVTRSHTVVG